MDILFPLFTDKDYNPAGFDARENTEGKRETPYKSSLKDMIYLSETADMLSLLSGQEAS